MNSDPVYLDYNATAPLRPEARDAMCEALAVTGNPSSVHGFGRTARRLVESAREAVAAMVGASPDQVVFTSGGTEANNLALNGYSAGRLLASAGEHQSVLQAVSGVTRSPLRPSGMLDIAALEQRLDAISHDGGTGGEAALLSIMLANNETGVVQPVPEAAELAHARGIRVHCDAVQGFGKLAVDVESLGADLISLSSHKLGGPAGVGALVLRAGSEPHPLLRGGGQERRRRAGTENLIAIAGFGAAARVAAAELSEGHEAPRLAALRDRLEAEIRARAPDALIFGAEARRLPNTSCISMPGVPAETQVMALDLAGVAVSAGAACSSGKVETSHVLRAMGAGEAAAGCAIRVSLGWASTDCDTERFVSAWMHLYERAKAA